MLLGVGTDILLIERMRACLDSSSFMRRTFTQTELNAGNWRKDQACYYAKVFAAKEAVFKSFGIPADQLGTWLNIEIQDTEEAKPEVRLSGLMAELARVKKVTQVALSLSSDTDYVVAFAVVERMAVEQGETNVQRRDGDIEGASAHLAATHSVSGIGGSQHPTSGEGSEGPGDRAAGASGEPR